MQCSPWRFWQERRRSCGIWQRRAEIFERALRERQEARAVVGAEVGQPAIGLLVRGQEARRALDGREPLGGSAHQRRREDVRVQHHALVVVRILQRGAVRRDLPRSLRRQ